MDRSAERPRADDEGSLDPRYDAIYQRGYPSDAGADPRPTVRSSDRSSDRSSMSPSDRAGDRHPRSPGAAAAAAASNGGFPRQPEASRDDGGSDETDGLLHISDTPDGAPPSRRWAVLLAVAGLMLILFGAWAYMVASPLQFQSWMVVSNEVRAPDGITATQVQLSQLALAIAPQLIILGVTAILADLAILTYGAATRARR